MGACELSRASKASCFHSTKEAAVNFADAARRGNRYTIRRPGNYRGSEQVMKR